MTHCVKTWTEYFTLQEQGIKLWELRKNDRNYKEGDTFISQEFDKDKQEYSGKESSYSIVHILSDVPQLGLKPGFCILTLKEKEFNG